MSRALTIAALAETATGIALVLAPAFVGQALLGDALTGAASSVARVAGIALVGLGIGCWPGPPVLGMLFDSAAVALCLAWFGLTGAAVGFFL